MESDSASGSQKKLVMGPIWTFGQEHCSAAKWGPQKNGPGATDWGIKMTEPSSQYAAPGRGQRVRLGFGRSDRGCYSGTRQIVGSPQSYSHAT
jgi:hypothetical protein